MTTDTAAAIERLRKHWTSDAYTITRIGTWEPRYIDDLRKIADLYLAENPADDGELEEIVWKDTPKIPVPNPLAPELREARRLLVDTRMLSVSWCQRVDAFLARTACVEPGEKQ